MSKITRRTFLRSAASVSLLSLLVKAANKKVLILGGTNFVGPNIVESGLKKGWNITLFNRGITNPQMFPKLRKIIGDRLNADDVQKLGGENWDIVIDTWSKNPQAVKISTQALKDKVSHYAYVSSISVYGSRNYQIVGLTEDAELPKLPPFPADSGNLDYTRRKIYAENFVREYFPTSHSIYRPHIIFGTDPATGTLNNSNLRIGGRCYWLWRIDKGGNILAPGETTDTVQYTDVRDLAGFITEATNKNLNGSYNVFNTLTMKEMFDSLISIKNRDSKPNLIQVPASFLFQNRLSSAGDVPMWVSHSELEKGFYQISNAKALKAGLQLRSALETFKETKEAFYKYHSDFNFLDEQNGVKLARVENELLDKWMSAKN